MPPDTPLLRAAESGAADVTRALLAAKADVRATLADRREEDVADEAARRIVAKLDLASASDRRWSAGKLQRIIVKLDLVRVDDAPAADGADPREATMNALHLASRAGHAAVVSVLLPHHEEKRRTSLGGDAARASRAGDANVASLMVRAGMDTLLALHLACEHGHANVASLLVRAGASANAKDAQGRTARDLAKGHSNVLVVLDE